MEKIGWRHQARALEKCLRAVPVVLREVLELGFKEATTLPVRALHVQLLHELLQLVIRAVSVVGDAADGARVMLRKGRVEAALAEAVATCAYYHWVAERCLADRAFRVQVEVGGGPPNLKLHWGKWEQLESGKVGALSFSWWRCRSS